MNSALDRIELDMLINALEADIRRLSEHARQFLNQDTETVLDDAKFAAWSKEHEALAVFLKEHSDRLEVLYKRLTGGDAA